jgi:hypothetical protein
MSALLSHQEQLPRVSTNCLGYSGTLNFLRDVSLSPLYLNYRPGDVIGHHARCAVVSLSPIGQFFRAEAVGLDQTTTTFWQERS